MTCIVVAAISARMLAEAARAEGFEVVALDLFGDRDTLRACGQHFQIGDAARLRIDAARLLATLATLARRGDVIGWVAGSGFDGRPDLLERGAALLPLLGTAADAVRRVRNPALFFGALDAHTIAHPQVRASGYADEGANGPADPAGWLVKDAGGCGGWHIRRARAHEAVRPPFYLQREVGGTPMSATFIANGSDACVLGFNRLIVRPSGARPHVFCGAIGPVALAPEPAAQVSAALRTLAARFALRGLASLDFIVDGERISVLEVNPRPPASIGLYAGDSAGPAAPSLIAAHLRACLQHELPRVALPAADAVVHGHEIVFAPYPFWLSDRSANLLARRHDCHDLPAGALHFEAGDPVCSVGASGSSAEQVQGLLQRSREAVYQMLEIHR